MRLFVAMLAVLAMVGTASAADYVWFVATPVQNAVITQQGAQGVSTIIESQDPGLPMIVEIAVMGSFVTCNGYDIGLKTPETDTSASSAVFTGVQQTGWVMDYTMAGNDGGLFRIAESNPISGNYTGVKQVASFVLTDIHEGDADDDWIYGGMFDDSYGWGDASTGGVAEAYFGAEYTDGYPSSWTQGACILIHEIPEPATLVLLGFGLVGLLRRR